MPPDASGGRGVGKGTVVTLGDALIDVVAEVGQDPVTDDDVPASIRLGLGGQAANVAAWCAHLGADARIVAPVAVDAGGRLVRESLLAQGVEWLGPGVEGRSGVVVSLAARGGSRTMLSDRGVSAGLDPADLRAEWFDRADWLHVSGYALFGSGVGACLEAARLARKERARVSLDLSAATLLRATGVDRVGDLIRTLGADLVFANELEQSVLGEIAVPVLVVKRGGAGARIVTSEGARDVEASEVVVRDTTGAGDAFAAGWLVGGIDMALAAAAACVGRIGAMPPAAA